MEIHDLSPQTETASDGPVATIPFEVVRRTEFVFEPFGGSLIQMPEARMQGAQSSEFFLAQSPTQIETGEASRERGEGVVWERPSSVSAPAEPRKEAALAQQALAQPQKAVKKKIPKENEAPRFYQPQAMRFFDPVAAAAEDGESEGETPQELGPRPSTQLSAELKAAILQIDEQRRQRQEEKENPAKDKKRGLLRGKSPKRVDSPRIQDETSALGAPLAKRSERRPTKSWRRCQQPTSPSFRAESSGSPHSKQLRPSLPS